MPDGIRCRAKDRWKLSPTNVCLEHLAGWFRRVLVRQTTHKAEELQQLKQEHSALDAAASDKRLALEELKTAIESERKQLTSVKNAASDLHTEVRKLTESIEGF